MWRLRNLTSIAQLQHLFTTARLRTTVVICLSLLFWLGLFGLFFEGFEFIVKHVGEAGSAHHARTVSFVFHLFFASLNVMLVFSSGIILYSGLYSSPDTRYLLTIPIRSERIVLYKFQEAVFFSSWGFFLLASPMMIAYGIVVGAPWHYFTLLLPLIVAFVYIPCGLGAIGCLWIAHKIPKLRKVIVVVAVILLLALAGKFFWNTINVPHSSLFGAEWFQETTNRFAFTRGALLPSTWLTGGLLEAARGPAPGLENGNWPDMPVVKSCLYLSVLISNALLLHLLIIWGAKRWFRVGFSRYECRHTRHRTAQIALVDKLATLVFSPFSPQVRLFLVKDWRLLRRDPVQWSQFLIFFGLLGLYLLNVDRFSNPNNNLSYVTWVHMVSFLNLAVVGLILSTFTTRFIYPMISLEGHCFWILGLLPVRRDTIIWSKFLFAAIGSWIPCAALILLSDALLCVSLLAVGLHQLTCVLLCFGLASIAVGLGAMMPNFKEKSPSKIAAGFGGTLNLVLSALYIIVTVVLTALPSHFFLVAATNPFRSSLLAHELLRYWLFAGIGLAVLIAALTTILPLRWGLRAFRRLEFY
jgi:ABC-2 type transport system permease protein